MEPRIDGVRPEPRESAGEVRAGQAGARAGRPPRVRGAFVSGSRAVPPATVRGAVPGVTVPYAAAPYAAAPYAAAPYAAAPYAAAPCVAAPARVSPSCEGALALVEPPVVRVLPHRAGGAGDAPRSLRPPSRRGVGPSARVPRLTEVPAAEPSCRPRPYPGALDGPCVPAPGRVRSGRRGGARHLAGEARLGLADRMLVGVAVVLGSAAAVVVLGLLAELAGAR